MSIRLSAETDYVVLRLNDNKLSKQALDRWVLEEETILKPMTV